MIVNVDVGNETVQSLLRATAFYCLKAKLKREKNENFYSVFFFILH